MGENGEQRLHVDFRSGEAYEIQVRGHRIRVDQPAGVGGADSAPTPTELFVASLAGCVAFYAGRYLTRHGYSREGLGVDVGYRMAEDRPARVATITLSLRIPADFPADRRAGLLAVAGHCTVHNSLVTAPTVELSLATAVATS